MKKALDLYFGIGVPEDPWHFPICQACGLPLRREEAHAHHKKRASAGGGEEPSNLLALHARCHAAIHHGGSRGILETEARDSQASLDFPCEISWTPAAKEILLRLLSRK